MEPLRFQRYQVFSPLEKQKVIVVYTTTFKWIVHSLKPWLLKLLSLFVNGINPPLHILRNKGLNRHVFTTTRTAAWARRDRSLHNIIHGISWVPQSCSRSQEMGTCAGDMTELQPSTHCRNQFKDGLRGLSSSETSVIWNRLSWKNESLASFLDVLNSS